MKTIARGQITIVDLNDGKSMQLFLSSNQPATQIHNKDNDSYVPDYTSDPWLVIIPELYVTGINTNQINSKPNWLINGSSDLSDYLAVASNTSPYTLTIKKNLIDVSQLKISCSTIYTDPDTSAQTTAVATTTITKSENAGTTIRAIMYAPDGTIFKNGNVTELKAHCDLWRGSTIDDTSVSYSWYQMVESEWEKITSENANGITGHTSNEITIPADAIINFASIKCVIKDTDSASNTYNTTVSDIISFADMSDPYQVECISLTGTTLKPGIESTTITANVWRNGEEMPSSFYSDVTIQWTKYTKTGAIDTAWGSDGVKTGRTITVSRSEISVASTFIANITTNN